MPKVKHTSINLDSRDELGIISDHFNRSKPNPQKPIEEVPRKMSLEIYFSSGKDRSHERISKGEMNIDENPSVSIALIADEDENSDESSSEESQPEKKAKISHKTEAESYPIDLMDCKTTHENLDRHRMKYNIPDDIKLKIFGKGNTPSSSPKGYVTLYSESHPF